MLRIFTIIFTLCITLLSTDLSAQLNTWSTEVFEDLNGDGDKTGDPLIPGIPDTELVLWQDVNTDGVPGTGGDIMYTYDLDAGGEYTWDNAGAGLPDGNYILEYNAGGGIGTYWVTQIGPGIGNNNDIEPSTGYTSFAVPMNAIANGFDQNEVDVDLGLFVPVVVETFIWDDANGNGVQDGGGPPAENGIGGIADGTFTLFDEVSGAAAVDGLGNPVLWVDMGAGIYEWQNVVPGDYHIIYTDPLTVGADDFYTTKFNQGGDNTSDSDSDPNNGYETVSFTVMSGETQTDYDAGFFLPATITTFVWNDANGDGIQDGAGPPAEDGITGEGGNFQLWDNVAGAQVLDVFGTPVVGAEIGAPGEYVFENVPPGPDYYIQYVIPADPGTGPYVVTQLDQGGDDTVDSDVDEATLQSALFDVFSDGMEEDVDAGFILPGKITCFVWEDANGDGLQDGAGPPAEDGIPGATATLYENDGATPALDITGAVPVFTPTGTPGEYEFINLAPGEYIVQFDVPPSPVAENYYPTVFNDDGMNMDANDMGMDSDADPANSLQSYVIELEAEENEERVDAGFYVPGKIGNQVFCDKDGSGLFDALDMGEGVANVTVTLVNNVTGEDPALDVNGAPLMEVTDGAGLYEFELVPPSLDYTIRFTAPAGFVITQQDVNGDVWPSDVDNDSDVNPGTELSESFELYSRDDVNELVNHDCGMYQEITIRGTIWLDAGMDNTYAGEPGVGGVLVEIYRAPDFSTPYDMTTSTGMGLYVFENLPPGMYYIRIMKSNFDDAQPLAGTIGCEGVEVVDGENPVDNDDNGDDTEAPATNVFTLLSSCDPGNPPVVVDIDFCFTFDCDEPNDLALPECTEAEEMVICNLPDLTGFCSRMFETNSGGSQPSPLCPGQGNTAAHNISWFAFIAGEGNYNLVIDPFACAGAGGANEGVQIGVYTSCEFTDAVFCNGSCNLNTVSVPSTNLVPGETYYIFIDGCNGSVCSYTIEIEGSYDDPPNFSADDLCIGDTPASADCNDLTVCEGTPINFLLTGIDLEIEYTWSVTANSGGPYDGDDQPETLEPFLEVTFDNIGEYTVCAESAYNGCAFWDNPPLCRTVEVIDIEDEFFETVFVCEGEADSFDPSVFDGIDPNGDGTTGWQAGSQAWSASLDGILNSFMVTIPDGQPLAGCTYEQSFILKEHPVAPTFDFYRAFCPDELPFFFSGNDTEYNIASFGGVNIYIEPNIAISQPTVAGCDSTVNLRLELLNILASPIAPECTADGIVIGYELPPYPGDWQLEFLWSGPSADYPGDNDSDGNPATIIADQGTGVYNLSIKIIKTLPDGTMKECIIPQGFGIALDVDLFIPTEPNVDGPETVCAGSTTVYTASSSSVGVTYVWSPPGGVSAVPSGDDNETLTVDWGTSSGGIIGVSSINECGESDEAFITISVVPQPTGEISVDPLVCQDSFSVIQFVGDPGTVSDFTWSFSGGDIQNGTGGAGPGPHNVAWSTPGVQYITMSFVDENGCVSETVLDSVTVEAPLPAPVVTCQQAGAGVGEVIFAWTDIPGSTYAFEITNPAGEYATAMIVNNTVVVTGVADGVLINLILTTTTTNACSTLISSAVACPAQSCVAPTVMLTTEIDELCLNNLDSLQQEITVTVTPTPDPANPGTTVFSGPGVDSATGMFDATAAGPGDHTITVVYTDVDGCVGGANTTIRVKEVPVASFTASADSICISDMISFTYTGSANPTQFIWDFGTGATATGAMGPNPMVSWATAGTKLVRLTVVKDGCSSETFDYPIKVQPLLEELVVTCTDQEDTSVTFGWNDVDGAIEYIVVVDSGAPTTQTGTSITVDGLVPLTEVSITVTAVPGPGVLCPGTMGEASCVALDCPDFTFESQTVDTVRCQGTGLSLIQLQFTFTNEATGMQASGLPSYNGNPNVNASTGTFDPNGLPAGEYIVQITFTEQPSMCTAPGSIRIVIEEQPDAQFTVSDPDICITEGSVLVNFTGTDVSTAGPLPWDISGGTIAPTANSNEFEWTFDNDTTYTINLTLGSGDCVSMAPEQTVIVTAPESIENLSCAPAGFGDIDLSWDVADCATEYIIFIDGVETATVTGTTYTAEDLSAGSHNFEVQATSSCECEIIPASTDCDAQECTPEEIGDVICVTGDIGEIDISWTGVPCAIEYTIFVDGNELATQTGTTYTATNLFAGPHNFVVQATSSCECEIIEGTNSGDCIATGCPPVTITSITAETQDWCLESDDLSTVTIDVTITGDDGSGTVTWTGGNGDGTFSPEGLDVGLYTVVYAYQEAGCPAAKDSIEFSIMGSPSVTPMTDSPDCYTNTEGFVSFIAEGGMEPYTIVVDGAPSTLEGMIVSEGSHTVEITDANGCSSMTTFAIVVPDPLDFDETSISGIREVIVNADATFTIDPSTTAGVTVDSIEWVGQDGTVYCNAADCFSLTRKFTEDELILVTIYYNSGCSVETSFTVTTRTVTIVDISNVFTPNGDGTNESFVIFTNSSSVVFNSVHIFDRWGNLVQFDPGWEGPGTHEVWNGIFNGSPVQPGVYVYTVDYTEDGKAKRRTGDITIVR